MVKLNSLLQTLWLISQYDDQFTLQQIRRLAEYVDSEPNSANELKIYDSRSYASWGFAKKRTQMNAKLIGYTNSRTGRRIKSLWVYRSR